MPLPDVGAGSEGSSPYQYRLKCVPGGNDCTFNATGTVFSRAVWGPDPDALTVWPLTPGTSYSCYTTAFNNLTGEPGLCSRAVQLVTPTPPTNVTTIALTDTSWQPSWVDGSGAFNSNAPYGDCTGYVGDDPLPYAYTAKCVMPGEACDEESRGTIDVVEPGTQIAETTGLTPSTAYTCYVVMRCLDDGRPLLACSAPINLTTRGS